MTTKRAGAFTGVARGGLGTGTALDETQVYDVAALNAPEPSPPEPVATKPTGPAPIATKASAPTAVAAPRRRAAAPRRAVPGPVWVVGGAAAAVLVFGLLGAVLGNPAPGTAGDGTGLDGGSNLPAALATPSIAPDGDGGKGKGNGRGGGNGNGGGD